MKKYICEYCKKEFLKNRAHIYRFCSLKCAGFITGFKKGYKRSEKANEKIRKSLIGNKHWQNKIHSEETKKKMSEAQKGKRHWNFGGHLSNETKRKMSEATSEEMGNNWKGDDVGYHGLHVWVKKHLGSPTKCEHCGKDGLFGKQIHWANIDHSYKRNLSDWIRLCSRCHVEYDKKLNSQSCQR